MCPNVSTGGFGVKEDTLQTNNAESSVHRTRLASAIMLSCVAFSVVFATSAYSQVEYGTHHFRISVDARGQVASIHDAIHGNELLAPDQPAPLVAVKVGDTIEEPSSAEFLQEASLIRLQYQESGVSLEVGVEEKDTHVTFEILRAEPADTVDIAIWGPYPVTINQTVGEVVGVVRDDDYAVGIQGLNIKTLGGYPDNEEGLNGYRGQTAVARPWGSVLQAYSMDRSRPRYVAAWNGSFPNMPVPPIPGETVIGSKIALFGCAAAEALDTIGRIELAEGLPHPMINGVWSKKSPEAGRSYMIADFSEDTIDEMLEYVQQSNLGGLYHGNPFRTWGHYEPSPRHFPNGVQGLKECVDKAKALDIRLGVHTLSNFIQPGDPYITPVPDPRLAKTGSSVLTQAIGPDTTEIPVASPEYFANEDANWMRTVMIGQELIRYRAVSEQEPWVLLDCVRGAFRTQAAAHEEGAEVGKLLDHPYRVFFPNLEMQREIAINLAQLFNETGLEQMDFDGHEGALASGQGSYAIELLAKDFYDHLEHTVLNGTSIASHFYWHINTYSNWGEPWYGGFRESMQEYRINNQDFFDRNFLPNMLGWYLMTETTYLSDMEWMLARAAGYSAGFALATSLPALRGNPHTSTILDAIREWEEARMSGAFTEEQRERLKDTDNEFHLVKEDDGIWTLYPFHYTEDFVYEQVILQPGEPTAAQWEVENTGEEQRMQVRLEVTGEDGAIVNPTFEVDNFATWTIPVTLEAGQSLMCEGETAVRIFDEKGNLINVVEAETAPPLLVPGTRSIAFECEFEGDTPPAAVVNFRIRGIPERVQKEQ